MTQQEFENIILKAFLKLDVSLFENLDDDAMYYYLTKEELIEEFTIVFSDFKSKGITSLHSKFSTCNGCYPKAKAYEFFNPVNQEPIVRYIVTKENDTSFILRLCSNNPESTEHNRQPF